jgi:hypothetical protein
MRQKAGLHSSAFLRDGSDVRIPAVPIEWLGGGPWRLPSGKALAEFALQSGFLAPLIFGSSGIGPGSANRGEAQTRKRVQRA